MSRKRSWFAPEVVQTSAMDCGPAALKAVLEGHDIHVSYGRLREACQTDVDGTSISTIAATAAQLGLNAEEVMLPADQILLEEADALPAIVVIRLPTGLTHFVVVWRTLGGRLQIMDPGTGRRWPDRAAFLSEVYEHTHPVPAAAWRQWAGTDEFQRIQMGRFRALGMSGGAAATTAQALIDKALKDPGWKSAAVLDAATRLVETVVRGGGLMRGAEAARVIERYFDAAAGPQPDPSAMPPMDFWSVQPIPPGPDGVERLALKGAVLVRIRGKHAEAPQPAESAEGAEARVADAPAGPLSSEILNELAEEGDEPERLLWSLFKAGGLGVPWVLAAGMLVSVAMGAVGMLLFRALLDVTADLALAGQRLGAFAGLVAFFAGTLLLELPIAVGMLSLGRNLEMRLRVAFLEKLPRIADRYFRSRLTSDMAERMHSVGALRGVPSLAAALLKGAAGIGVTLAGMTWLDPGSLPTALVCSVLCFLFPLIVQKPIAERDLRLRTYVGALSNFYLDAMRGLSPIRTHGAERPIRRAHESLLSQWIRAAIERLQISLVEQGARSVLTYGVTAILLFDHFSRVGESGTSLLLTFWAMQLPKQGQGLAGIFLAYPALRNRTLRLLEPLGAPEEQTDEELAAAMDDRSEASTQGVRIELRKGRVIAGGHTILQDATVTLKPGEHIGVVGPSGAGKSTLAGLLIGFGKLSSGELLVDGQPLTGGHLQRIRRETAWVDSSVQLWNRSLVDNLRYGSEGRGALDFAPAIDGSDLRGVLERLPEGLQTRLGEGGGLVSGGEGQRVRLGRAWMRSDARLVILDEAFRGLDRGQRAALVRRAREHWKNATLICVTHDVAETAVFDRVLVVADGHIIEDADPKDLAKGPSRYAQLLAAERAVTDALWGNPNWRRLRMRGGVLDELPPQETPEAVAEDEVA